MGVLDRLARVDAQFLTQQDPEAFIGASASVAIPVRLVLPQARRPASGHILEITGSSACGRPRRSCQPAAAAADLIIPYRLCMIRPCPATPRLGW